MNGQLKNKPEIKLTAPHLATGSKNEKSTLSATSKQSSSTSVSEQ